MGRTESNFILIVSGRDLISQVIIIIIKNVVSMGKGRGSLLAAGQ
jgi:hypothetical protein